MRLLNAFSPNMLSSFPASVSFRQLGLVEARRIGAAGVQSCVGHAETAAVFAAELGVAVPYERVTVTLLPGEVCLLGQYRGPRLPEGATSLPDGASIQWLLVEVR
ncbi:MAG: DUF1874 domain-containing protein [Gemmataceae bacterium]|nr:DUF1874 domain-containing protein [Gemmataceae bacterium]